MPKYRIILTGNNEYLIQKRGFLWIWWPCNGIYARLETAEEVVRQFMDVDKHHKLARQHTVIKTF